MAVLLKTARGKDKLAYRGYLYTLAGTNITTQNWRCERQRQDKCRGSASTLLQYTDGCTVHELRPHNHVPDVARQTVQIAMSDMVEAAATSTAPPRRVISETVAGLTQESLSIAPKRKALTTRIQRKRAKVQGGLEPIPTTRVFEIPDRFQKIRLGDQEFEFLRHDDLAGVGEDDDNFAAEDRILIFAIEPCLEILSEAETWMSDGTFKVPPSIFYQFTTIHAVVGDWLFPCVFALLPNKTQATYIRLLENLNTIRPGLRPYRIILDFELAAHNAFKFVYPDIEVQACFFHFSQSCWRKLQDVGLRNDYIDNEGLRVLVRSFVTLAFLPLDQVTPAFEVLEETAETYYRDIPLLEEFVSYFEQVYIGRHTTTRHRTRRTPRYPAHIWNVRERTVEGLPRTNNRLEGWHRAIQTLFDSPHPSMWRFLDGLKKEQALVWANLQFRAAGRQPPAQEKRYQEINKSLQTLIAQYDSGAQSLEQFLRGCAYNIKLAD